MKDLKDITRNQARDTGLALILILLIIQYVRQPGWLVIAAIAVLVVTMVWPSVFKPLAKLWFGFSHLLGGIVSKVILSLVFFLIVTPVGLLRKAMGADPMKTKLWKKGDKSVLVERSHRYVKEDIEKPY